MENRDFDSLVKSLARGANRRSVLRAMLGLGGAAAAGSVLRGAEVDAARRPTPTPKPVVCPGSQHWNGSACVCTTGETCGSACCLMGSECCDGACCFGHCYGEELCCSYDNWCDAAGECCPDGATCCGEQGCVVIEEGDCGCGGECPEGFECCGGQCCSSGYCAGGICCAFGVCGDVCREDPLQVCCGGVPYIPETHYCCDGIVVEGECCASSGCGDELECCGSYCCVIGSCVGEACCQFGVCGGSCLTEEGQGCCDGQPYDPETHYCCNDVLVEGECCPSGGCPSGFECCFNSCCAEGLCSNDGCCAFLSCGGICSQGPGYGCCNGDLYELDFAICCNNTIAVKAGHVCCDNALYDGNCCVDAECGTCSTCDNHRCSNLRC